MRKTIFTLICCCLLLNVFAQADTSLLYLRFPAIPVFNILKVPDSTSFTQKDLAKKKPVVFFFFNPDCDHCHQETKNMIAKIDQLKNAQVLMISILDFNAIKKFHADFKIADYPNITMARETTTHLPTFFKVHGIPDVYVYDKKGKFLEHFKGSVPVEKIAALF
jgi:thioredoxin-related protein